MILCVFVVLLELSSGPSAQPHTSFYPWTWLRQNSYDPPLDRTPPPEYAYTPLFRRLVYVFEQEDPLGFQDHAGAAYSDVRRGHGGG